MTAAPAPPRRRALWVLLLIQAALVMSLVMLLRPAVSYNALQLGVDSGWLGLIAGSFALVPVLVVVPIGRISDRRGTRVVMAVGGALSLGAAIGLLVSSHSLVGLVAANLLLGFGQIVVIMCLQSGVADLWPPERRDNGYGWFSLAAALGQMLGPGALAVLGGSESTPEIGPVYAVGVGIAIAMVAIAAAWLFIGPGPSDGGAHEIDRRFGAALRVPGLAPAVLTSVTVLTAIDLLGVYLPAIGVEYGIPSSVIGVLLMVRAGASVLSRAFMGMLLRSIGRRILLVGSLVVAGISIALVAVPLPVPVLVGLMLLAGFGLGYGQPLTLSWLANAAPPGVRGTALGIRMLGNRLGQAIVPAGAGALTASSGSAAVFVISAAALGAVAVLSARARL